MNQILTDRIIKKLSEEKCPKHNQNAEFEGKGGVIVIKKFCCDEFYNFISKRIQEELSDLSKRF